MLEKIPLEMVHHLYHLDVGFLSTVSPIHKGNDKGEGLQGWKGTHVPLLPCWAKLKFISYSSLFPELCLMFSLISNKVHFLHNSVIVTKPFN